jgi:hypothetical protein
VVSGYSIEIGHYPSLFRTLVIVAFISALVLGAWGLRWEPASFRVQEHKGLLPGAYLTQTKMVQM